MDFFHLQQIFPAEIWQLIAANWMEVSPAHLENLANSSPFFRNMLAPHRTSFLFEKVIEIVASTIWKTNGLEGLPVRSILTCRRVSSHWNSTIEKLIPEKFQFIGKDSSDNELVSIGHAFKEIISNTLDDRCRNRTVQDLTNHFRWSHRDFVQQANRRNPFVWPNLLIRTTNERDIAYHQRILESYSSIIAAHGRFIHHFTIVVEETPEFFDNLLRFQRWIQCMPNITKLSIYCGNASIYGRVAEYEENNHVFRLEHLKCLETRNLSTPVFNMLIQQNSHLTTLFVKNCTTEYDFFGLCLPNLKTLALDNVSREIILKIGSPEIQWPLESLTLALGYDVNCAALLEVIQNKFADTLTYLELNLNAVDEMLGPTWQDFKTCRLNLPKLKRIKLEGCARLTCLDFLLPMCDNLEEISINGGRKLPLPYQLKVKKGVSIQFIGFEGMMLESNIWCIFTKLKRIEIKHRWEKESGARYWLYLREEWEKRKLFILN